LVGGRHLAALLADHPLVAMVAPISGIFDLEPIRQTRYYHALKLTDAEVDALSPLRLDPVAKPHLTFVGGLELPELRRQSLAFSQRRVGARDGFYEIAGRHHFDVLDELIAPEGMIFLEIARNFEALF
jgi:arylformamidase